MFEFGGRSRLDHFEIHSADFSTRAHDVVFCIAGEIEAFLLSYGSEKECNFPIAFLYIERQFEIQRICFDGFSLQRESLLCLGLACLYSAFTRVPSYML